MPDPIEIQLGFFNTRKVIAGNVYNFKGPHEPTNQLHVADVANVGAGKVWVKPGYNNSNALMPFKDDETSILLPKSTIYNGIQYMNYLHCYVEEDTQLVIVIQS